VSLDQLADHLQSMFQRHYQRTSPECDPMLTETRFEWNDSDWERPGDPVPELIVQTAKIAEPIASDLAQVLMERHDHPFEEDEQEFAAESRYEARTVFQTVFHHRWQEAIYRLSRQARFFDPVVFETLRSIFQDLYFYGCSDQRSLIRCAGPAQPLSTLYRARAFQSEQDLLQALQRPDLHLGPPPASIARAGRLNAFGIAVFYGANDPAVALAEVRAPVGSKVALVRFEIIRPLRLLDLTAAAEIHTEGSLFDPQFRVRLDRASFLKTLGSWMARPVVPVEEPLEYLPTQAIADYLSADSALNLDGIIYPSPQSRITSGFNIVLFHKAARPELRPAQFQVHQDCGPETFYGYQLLDDAPLTGLHEFNDDFDGFYVERPDQGFEWIGDQREHSIRIDVETLVIHEVQGVEMATVDHPVIRFSFKESLAPKP
jgi:hypothetical protein